ncbi:hypothetical protein SLS58_005948 [Diplodia intermedia]|uniref:Carboxypeptidase n=1 Tax=Diplodia intermedia TaxID=856260 RepID=A0ABR3TPL9_9PEZI
MPRWKLISVLATLQAACLRSAQAIYPPFEERGLPENATDLKVIRSPQGAEIRYKEPMICETTPGVKSYSGYISLNKTTNMYFWFFEKRQDPHDAPFTLWLNDPALSNKNVDFHLWTESYGGHYGPAFYDYFYEHNLAIGNGTENGTQMNMGTLGIINGIIDAQIQSPYYYIFANNNTYGIKAVNDSVYTFMESVYHMPNGCSDYLSACAAADRSTFHGKVTCATASNICRGLIRNIYTSLSGRGTYDIRHPHDDPTPPDFFVDFLNLADTQRALGVSLNYTSTSSAAVSMGFGDHGDFAYPSFKGELEALLERGVRVALFYGDADFTCNWMGGEAVALALEFAGQEAFRGAGYAPLVVGGTEYGVVRQHGNFSFARIYESGHEIPYYQPEASLEFFKRTLEGLSVSDGAVRVGGGYGTNGTAEATHTQSYVPLPTCSPGVNAC